MYEYVLLIYIEPFSSLDDVCEESLKCFEDKLSIPKIHCAYEESKQLLDLLREAFLLEKSLGGKLFRIISDMRPNKDRKLSCLVLVLLEEIIALCYHRKERTAREELAEKYVSQIRQWQPIVEKGLSFVQPDEFHIYQLKIRSVYLEIVLIIILYLLLNPRGNYIPLVMLRQMLSNRQYFPRKMLLFEYIRLH